MKIKPSSRADAERGPKGNVPSFIIVSSSRRRLLFRVRWGGQWLGLPGDRSVWTSDLAMLGVGVLMWN